MELRGLEPLTPTLSGGHNVTLPTTLAGGKLDHPKVDDLFEWLGLDGPVLSRRPDEMSGGQQQPVALARALAHQSTVVSADEPTGSLDTESAANAVSLLRRVADDFGTRVVLVTHDPSIAKNADTVFSIRDGQLIQEASELVETRSAADSARLPNWSLLARMHRSELLLVLVDLAFG